MAEPTDQFKGAEGSIDKQRADALNALASLGRRGLESAAIHQKIVGGGAAPTTTGRNWFDDVNPRGNADAGSILRNSQGAYADDARRAIAFQGAENKALSTVQGTYFNEARQAVPGYRANAQTITDTYRKNYEERQAAIRAQEEMLAEAKRQAALNAQLQQQSMEQSAAIAAAQLAAINASGGGGGGGGAGGGYGPDLIAQDTAYQNVMAATAAAAKKAQQTQAAKATKKKVAGRIKSRGF